MYRGLVPGLLALLVFAGCSSAPERTEPPNFPDPTDVPTGRAEGDVAPIPIVEVEVLPTAPENYQAASQAEQRAFGATDPREQEAALQEAIAYWRAGLRQDPTNRERHRRYQTLLSILGASNPAYSQRMLVDYEALWLAAPREAMPAYLYATALATVRRFEEAAAIIETARPANPDDYWLHIAGGQIAWERAVRSESAEDREGFAERANQMLRKAVLTGVMLNEFDAHRSLARVFLAQGSAEAAAQLMLAVLRAEPGRVLDDYLLLAQAHLRAGRPTLAEQTLMADLPSTMAARTRNQHLRALADIYRAQDKRPIALWTYRQYLRFHPEAEDRAEVEQLIAALDAEVAAGSEIASAGEGGDGASVATPAE